MAGSPASLLDELTLGRAVELESLVDRGALREMAESARQLFGASIRIGHKVDGGLIVDPKSGAGMFQEHGSGCFSRSNRGRQEYGAVF